MTYRSDLAALAAGHWPASWRFGDASGSTAADASGSSHPGTYVGSPTLGTAGLLTADADTAVTLNGSSQYVRSDSTFASWMDPANVTVIAWIKTSTSGTPIIVARDSGSASGVRAWQFRLNNGNLEFVRIRPSVVTVTASPTVDLDDNVRHMVAFTWDGTTLKMYADGAQVASTAVSAVSGAGQTSYVEVGARNTSGTATQFLGGVVDEFDYLDIALTGTDIANLWTAGTTAPGITISAPTSTATAQAHAPTLSFTKNVAIAAVAATATAAALAPTISFTSAEDIGVVLPAAATATAAAHAPTILFATSFTIAPPAATATADAHAPTVTITDVLDLTVAPPTATATADALAPVVVIGNPPIGTDTSNVDDGLDLGGSADVLWEPDVAAPPIPFSLADERTRARVVTTPPTWGQSFAPGEGVVEGITATRLRVLIGDTDYTYFRGHPAQVGTIRLIDPLLYGTAEVTLPGILVEYPGMDLDVFKHANVRIQSVNADSEVVATRHKGMVTKIDADERGYLRLEIGGQAAARLSPPHYVPPPVYRRTQDVEHILCDLLRDARVRAHEHDGSSGVGLIRRGGTDGLSVFHETLAIWAGATGSPITFTPNARGAYRKTVKDTTTIHGTVYPDRDLITVNLSRDFMAEVNRVYARGRTKSGELVTGIRTPGMTQGEAPDFPLASGVLEVGMDDADTTSGAGVTAVQQQLTLHNFLDYSEVTPGEYTAEVASAVMTFQAVAGLNVTGQVGPNAWEALWDLGSIGYSLDDAREYPLAEDPAVRKWNRTANGSKIEANPLYDPHVQPVDEFIDVGQFGKGKTRDFAQSRLAPAEGIWTGTITFKSGLVAGEHNPEDAFTSADVMDRRDLVPNMRLWLPYFAGGIVVYVSGVDHGPEDSQAAVSTLPQTTMETWTAIARALEAKSKPGNTWSGHVRSSQVRNDEEREWDTSSGWLANPVPLTGGSWTEVKVPAGQRGTVKELRCQVENAAEYALLLTMKPVSLDALNSRDGISAPLSAASGGQRPWFEREAIVDWLEGRGYLDAWGWVKQPCGYDPSRKTDDEGSTGESPTGRTVEVAGFEYETDAKYQLYLYVWIAASNTLLPGRILRNQRATDF